MREKSEAPVSVKLLVSKTGMLSISPNLGKPIPSNISSTLGIPLIVKAAPAVLSLAPLPAAGSSVSIKCLYVNCTVSLCSSSLLHVSGSELISSGYASAKPSAYVAFPVSSYCISPIDAV